MTFDVSVQDITKQATDEAIAKYQGLRDSAVQALNADITVFESDMAAFNLIPDDATAAALASLRACIASLGSAPVATLIPAS